MKITRSLAIIAAIATTNCGYLVPEEEACRAATAHGFSQCAITGSSALAPAWSGCANGDAVAFDVSATNPAGQRTSLIVCCGWPFKGCTLRTR